MVMDYLPYVLILIYNARCTKITGFRDPKRAMEKNFFL